MLMFMLYLIIVKNICYFLIFLIFFRIYLIVFYVNLMEYVDFFIVKMIICVFVMLDGLGKMVFCIEIINRFVKKLFFYFVLYCWFVVLILIRWFFKGFVVY